MNIKHGPKIPGQVTERGALKLEDDIRQYLPDFDTGGRVITLRQLLEHTSGIRDMTAPQSKLSDSRYRNMRML